MKAKGISDRSFRLCHHSKANSLYHRKSYFLSQLEVGPLRIQIQMYITDSSRQLNLHACKMIPYIRKHSINFSPFSPILKALNPIAK